MRASCWVASLVRRPEKSNVLFVSMPRLWPLQESQSILLHLPFFMGVRKKASGEGCMHMLHFSCTCRTNLVSYGRSKIMCAPYPRESQPEKHKPTGSQYIFCINQITLLPFLRLNTKPCRNSRDKRSKICSERVEMFFIQTCVPQLCSDSIGLNHGISHRLRQTLGSRTRNESSLTMSRASNFLDGIKVLHQQK